MSRPIALDLGTAAVRIREPHRDSTFIAPSVIAVNTHEDTVLATGERARALLGRTPAGIRAVRPILSGTVVDYELALRMIREYFNATKTRRPVIVTAVPADLTEEETKALSDVLLDAGAGEVRQIPSALASAYGAGYSPETNHAVLVADIGAGTSDVAILRRGAIVIMKSSRFGGDALDRALCDFLCGEHSLVIGQPLSEQIKREIGSAHPSIERGTRSVSGRSTETGLAAMQEISGEEVFTAYLPIIKHIIKQLTDALASVPPEIAGEVREQGILLCGGTAALPGLAKAVAFGTGIRTAIAPEHETCAVRGLCRVIEEKIPVSRVSAQNNKIVRKGGADS